MSLRTLARPVLEASATLRLAMLVLLLSLPAAAEPFTQNSGLDQRMIAEVTGTALAFMSPRILQPERQATLVIWGLRGLATIDPKLATDLSETELRLSLQGKPLASEKLPAEGDAAGWGRAIAALARAAWDSSEPVRRVGTTGVISNFFDELFNHLDPYSRYATPEEAAQELARRNGRAGVGIEMARQGTGFVLRSVAPGSPAAKAGVKPGERLLAIDDLPLDDADLAAINALLAGPEDSIVTLTLKSPGAAARPARSLDLRRTVLTPPTVFASRQGKLLLIQVTGFARNTAERMGAEIVHGLAGPRPPEGIVIDLRGNRGGLLRQAVAAAELLQPTGRIAASIGRDPQARHDYEAEGTDLAHGLPVALLVDGRTASAAEVLVAALSDQRRAVVIGSSTFGKGLVQTILPLPDGGALSLTWSRVVSPLGWPLQALGVMPSICTSLGEQSLRASLAELAQGRQPMTRPLTRHTEARAPLPAPEILEIRNYCPASEGRDTDLLAAKFIIDTPKAYATALLNVPIAP